MDIVLNFILYFLFFAIIHSYLAMDDTKNKTQKLLGKRYRYYRLIYSLISIPLFAPAYMIWMKYASSTPIVYSIMPMLYPVIIMVRLGAIGVFGYAAMQIDVLEFIGIKNQKKKVLLTKGAYGIVRHPLYTSGILLLFTQMKMTLLDLTLVLLFCGYFLLASFIEERRLLRVFGEEYRTYQTQVSMFIPVKWLKTKLL